MPTFISDPPFFVYALLIVAVIVSGSMWWSRRTRPWLIIFASFLALLLIVILLDRLFESPREEANRRVLAMTRAADARDRDAFLSHVAESIQYRGESGQPITILRENLRNSAFWEMLKQYNVHVAAWDFDPSDVTEIDDNTVEIGFLAKGEADGKQAPLYFRAKFHRQPDGQMKLIELASFDPIKRVKEPKSIPLFP